MSDEKNLQSVPPEQPLVAFVEQASEVGEFDSSGGFTSAGRRLIKKIGHCLLPRPTAWTLLAVQLANRWRAESLRFRLEGGVLQLEFRGVGDKRDWLEGMLAGLTSGELAADEEQQTAQKLLWSALAQAAQSIVVVASGASEADAVVAVEIGVSSLKRGGAQLLPGRFLLQLELAAGHTQALAESLKAELHLYACSDRTLVTFHSEIDSFFPLSTRRSDEPGARQDRGLALGLWALPLESDSGGVLLGRSFSSLDSSGISRRELSFGVFRTGLLGGKPALQNLRARTVVLFTHHQRPLPSRVVWLRHGVEVAHQSLSLPSSRLAVTLYREVPDGLRWDVSGLYFQWDAALMSAELVQAREDFLAALAAMVKEYNHYSPGVDGSTLGCWGLLGLASIAGGGMLAPVLGSYVGLGLALFSSVGLMGAEYRYRHRERLTIGQSLSALVEESQKLQDPDFGLRSLLTPAEQDYPSLEF